MPYKLDLSLITLYSSDAELKERVKTEEIARFVKAALAASGDWYDRQNLGGPSTRYLVVVLGPGRQARIVVGEHNTLLPGEAGALVEAYSRAASDVDVTGPVVFGMQYTLGPAPAGFPVPWPAPPARWLQAAQSLGGAESLSVDDVALYFLASEQGPVQ